MALKFFQPKRRDDPPGSTQFAATTLVVPPGAAGEWAATTLMPADPLPSGAAALEPAHADSSLTDSAMGDSTTPDPASPDVVTDIGDNGGDSGNDTANPAGEPTISHIGRYALKRRLGEGGLGAVFEAWDPLLSRAVAVKTLQFDVDARARVSLDGLFLNEARAAAGLSHKYIVTIHDAGLSAHGVYIAMERLYGRDLQQALADGWRPTVEQAVQLVRRVAEALAYAHARGVVHCDIKPANIYLTQRQRPKVLDFGIARVAHGRNLSSLDGAVAGSPRYRAPEQLGGGQVDARTDLFSLGAVFYELLSGTKAFEGRTLADIDRAVLEDKARPVHELNPAVPQDLSELVSRLIARDPAQRFTCATELVSTLRAWSAAHGSAHGSTTRRGAPPTSAAVPKGVPGAGLAVRTRARFWWAAAALAIAGAGVLAWVASPQGRTTRPAHDTAPAPAAATAERQVQPLPQEPLPAPGPGAVPLLPASPAGSADGPADTAGAPAPSGAATVPTALTAPSKAAAGPVQPPAAIDKSRTRPAVEKLRARPLAATEAAAREAPGAELPSSPVAAAPGPGTIQLAISPWGEVEVDGQRMGTTPPLSRLTLAEGTYAITVRNGDFPPHQVQLRVEADKAVVLRHRFGS